MDVKDKVVVVTGGASGIGEALAKLFAAEGAKAVAIADMDAEGAERVAGEIGPVAKAYRLDVTDGAAVKAMVEDVEASAGPVDLYCSNAGIIFSDAPTWSVINCTDAQWQKIWEVNVFAHVLACRAVLPGMIERGSGAFLITASAAGLLSQIGDSSYSTTKHAAVGFAESLAIAHGDDGIYVGCLCPQAVTSKMTAGAEKSSAAADGIMPAEELATRTLAMMREGRFMIRPHEQVEGYFKHKANDYDRWVGGMRKFRRNQLATTGRPI
ncbi:SDR family oxidoreductase [Kordiimonas lipolytica]|uniref:SDR family oxidoreductase n=1 Tax=Kordiimonas lipolytica TaxID=1662421 RepID=A0ABV8UCR2_9PROT|nr:SDR family oxidoreductase [Kordiimonas lipolytica]